MIRNDVPKSQQRKKINLKPKINGKLIYHLTITRNPIIPIKEGNWEFCADLPAEEIGNVVAPSLLPAELDLPLSELLRAGDESSDGDVDVLLLLLLVLLLGDTCCWLSNFCMLLLPPILRCLNVAGGGGGGISSSNTLWQQTKTPRRQHTTQKTSPFVNVERSADAIFCAHSRAVDVSLLYY